MSINQVQLLAFFFSYQNLTHSYKISRPQAHIAGTCETHSSPDKLLNANFKGVMPSLQKPGKKQESQRDCEYLRTLHVVSEGEDKDNTVTGSRTETGQCVSQWASGRKEVPTDGRVWVVENSTFWWWHCTGSEVLPWGIFTPFFVVDKQQFCHTNSRIAISVTITKSRQSPLN